MKCSIKELLADILNTVHVVEAGVDASGWHYKKYSDGTLEAERTRNIGQYTISTTVASPIRSGATVSSALPSEAISGDVEITLVGNTSNSACWMERIGNLEWRIVKVTTGNVTLQGLTVSERTIGARWK